MTDADWAGVTAVSTVVLGALALFGDSIRWWIYRPRLRISLLDPDGERTLITDAQSGAPLYSARMFHLCIGNTQRLFTFRGVSVVLRQVLVMRPGGWRAIWKGTVPMQWRHEPPARVPFAEKNVGPVREADLFKITSDQELHLNTLFAPNNLEVIFRRDAIGGDLRLALDVQAIGEEGDSKVMRVEVGWDWTWKDGQSEFRDHLTVAISEAPPLKDQEPLLVITMGK